MKAPVPANRLRLMTPNSRWLPALRRYACVIVVGNLAWEFAQLPFYTLWRTGPAREIILAVFHCTGGDMLIAGSTLAGSLLLLGTADWPRARFLPVAAATLISGIGTTAYSEYRNTARGVWTYSDLMPVLPGTGIGLAPLAQWIVIPLLAFAAARPVRPAGCPGLPTMEVATSGSTPDPLARFDRRMS